MVILGQQEKLERSAKWTNLTTGLVHYLNFKSCGNKQLPTHTGFPQTPNASL